MNRPRLLDLFCGAGGCSMGYHRAGFDVYGVDIEPHPDHPFELIAADALDVLRDRAFLSWFEAIHASPPCQGYSTATADHTRHPRLIGEVRELLRVTQKPYVIENVQGARPHMDHPVTLCGSAFGLRVRRHRLFESNVFLLPTQCNHALPAIGVYGDHPDRPGGWLRPDGTSRGVKATSLEDAQDAMGIDWMTRWDDLADAIPPAYTEYIGAQLLDQLEAVA